ncbi:putative phage related protein, partial [Lactococcus cremoris subsp. cremoris GE214]
MTDKLISLVIKVCDWVANLKENKKMTVKEKFLNDIKSL